MFMQYASSIKIVLHLGIAKVTWILLKVTRYLLSLYQ